MVGSSPLARGAQAAVAVGDDAPGLIPARAGSTPAPGTASLLRRAHPRSRGEHKLINRAAVRAGGSSPLARGAPTNHADDGSNRGLIPARAGST